MHFHLLGSSPQSAPCRASSWPQSCRLSQHFIPSIVGQVTWICSWRWENSCKEKCKPCLVHAVSTYPCPLLVPLTACPFGLSPYLRWPPNPFSGTSTGSTPRLRCWGVTTKSLLLHNPSQTITLNVSSNSTHVFIGPCMGTNYAFKNITGKCCKWLS